MRDAFAARNDDNADREALRNADREALRTAAGVGRIRVRLGACRRI
jgi:hypothetical protein